MLKIQMYMWMDTIEEQNHKSRFFSNIIATAVIWINVTQSKTDLGTKKNISTSQVGRFQACLN